MAGLFNEGEAAIVDDMRAKMGMRPREDRMSTRQVDELAGVREAAKPQPVAPPPLSRLDRIIPPAGMAQRSDLVAAGRTPITNAATRSTGYSTFQPSGAQAAADNADAKLAMILGGHQSRELPGAMQTGSLRQRMAAAPAVSADPRTTTQAERDAAGQAQLDRMARERGQAAGQASVKDDILNTVDEVDRAAEPQSRRDDLLKMTPAGRYTAVMQERVNGTGRLSQNLRAAKEKRLGTRDRLSAAHEVRRQRAIDDRPDMNDPATLARLGAPKHVVDAAIEMKRIGAQTEAATNDRAIEERKVALAENTHRDEKYSHWYDQGIAMGMSPAEADQHAARQEEFNGGQKVPGPRSPIVPPPGGLSHVRPAHRQEVDRIMSLHADDPYSAAKALVGLGYPKETAMRILQQEHPLAKDFDPTIAEEYEKNPGGFGSGAAGMAGVGALNRLFPGFLPDWAIGGDAARKRRGLTPAE